MIHKHGRARATTERKPRKRSQPKMELDYIERIKKLKAEKRMTNDELAKASGIPLGTLSKILAGLNDSVKLSNVVAICEALDCNVDYIVSGTPENANNFTLDATEIRLIENFRRLDEHSRDLVKTVVAKELERELAPAKAAPSIMRDAVISAPAARRYAACDAARKQKRRIPLYDLPVSAGIGEYLDGTTAETLAVSDTAATEKADFALRISGNSMEPKYHSGDVLLVQSADAVEVGEPCVYVLDGCGYFKIYGGDCLISLNPEYGRIMLKDFENVSCAGKVLGRLKKK